MRLHFLACLVGLAFLGQCQASFGELDSAGSTVSSEDYGNIGSYEVTYEGNAAEEASGMFPLERESERGVEVEQEQAVTPIFYEPLPPFSKWPVSLYLLMVAVPLFLVSAVYHHTVLEPKFERGPDGELPPAAERRAAREAITREKVIGGYVIDTLMAVCFIASSLASIYEAFQSYYQLKQYKVTGKTLPELGRRTKAETRNPVAEEALDPVEVDLY